MIGVSRGDGSQNLQDDLLWIRLNFLRNHIRNELQSLQGPYDWGNRWGEWRSFCRWFFGWFRFCLKKNLFKIFEKKNHQLRQATFSKKSGLSLYLRFHSFYQCILGNICQETHRFLLICQFGLGKSTQPHFPG